jgi:general stress protein 26
LQAEGHTANPAQNLLYEVTMQRYVPRTIRQLRRLLKDLPIGMLTTQTPNGASHARPMLVHDVDEGGWLWFITDRYSRKACELSQNPHATIAFQSKKGDRYISVQGTAVVVRDDVKLKELWNPTLRSWFPRGRRDPEIVLVAMRVARAEYWLLPRTRLARVIGILKALATGKRHEGGKHGVLDLYPALT